LQLQDFGMAARKARIDSPAEAVRVMKTAVLPIVPPAHVHLEDIDQPFWRSVIGEFARAEWTDHQLELAAMLARSMADLEREQRDLRTEGSISFTEKGTPVANPRKAVVQMLAGTILSMRRSLSLHARAQAGEARDVGTRRKATQEIEANNPLHDDMLGMPQTVQ
jgi:hypothetical protein